MRLEYSPDTDTLYIGLKETPGADAREVGPGVVLDVDASDGAVQAQVRRRVYDTHAPAAELVEDSEVRYSVARAHLFDWDTRGASAPTHPNDTQCRGRRYETASGL